MIDRRTADDRSEGGHAVQADRPAAENLSALPAPVPADLPLAVPAGLLHAVPPASCGRPCRLLQAVPVGLPAARAWVWTS
ncbi:hypothetical protein ACFQ07_19145 [Actinomadura adrarensis]|uniref:Uncharacterized protein n=1 Tax=Actinomadura adrarensis TaxID=1819600 RepID=A0ABW3CIZ5_9ACTN